MKTPGNIFSIKNNRILYITMVVIACLIILCFLSLKLTLFSHLEQPSDRNIEISRLDSSPTKYHMMWWETANDKLNLHVNYLNNLSTLKIYGITQNKTIAQLPVKSKVVPVTNELDGSYNAVLAPFQADINTDGKMETVKLYAKLDTLLTQGFAPKPTLFAKKEITMEIQRIDDHTLCVLFNQRPLTHKSVILDSANGLFGSFDLGTDGTVHINDTRDMRSGINVVYTENNTTVHIAYYKLEAHVLFGTRYLKAMLPLLAAIAISVEIVLFILFLRRRFFDHNETITEISYMDFDQQPR